MHLFKIHSKKFNYFENIFTISKKLIEKMDEKQIAQILSYQFTYGCDKIYCQNIYCRNCEKFKYKEHDSIELSNIIEELSKTQNSQKYICKNIPPMVKNPDLVSILKELKNWTFRFISDFDNIEIEIENCNYDNDQFQKRTKKIEEAIYKINDISDYLPYFLLSNDKPLSPSNPSIDEQILYNFTSKASSIRELSAALLSLVNSNVDLIQQSNFEYYSSIRCFLIIFSFPQIIDYRHQDEVLIPMISLIQKLPKVAKIWLTILPKTISASVGCCQFSISNYFSNHLKASPHITFITNICKSLSILYDANLNGFFKIPISQFYNYHINERITAEDELSLNRDFSFLRFPFVLSLKTKYKLCKVQSDQIMSSLAVSSFIFSFPQRLVSKNGNKIDPFLSLHIRRDHILEDADSQLKSKGQNSLSFLKKLKVIFEGENAVDIGGPSREFLYLSTEKLFDPQFGLFTIVNDKFHWFNKKSPEGIFSYETVGIIVGLAVYNSYLLPIQFPTVLYKKLLFSDRELNLVDLEEIDPQAADSLKKIKIMKNSGEDINSLDLTFDTTEEIEGKTITVPLKKGMGGIHVNSGNIDEYVQAYIDYELKTSIKKKFDDFQRGFLMPCRAPLYQLLDPSELSILVSGETVMDWASLKKNVEYQDGYDANTDAVNWFWDIFNEMDNDEKKLFLKFVTGTDKAPLGGLGNVKLVIQKSDEIEKLPMAHTCFNTFCLPDYKSKKIMEKKIKIAIQYTEGFGII